MFENLKQRWRTKKLVADILRQSPDTVPLGTEERTGEFVWLWIKSDSDIPKAVDAGMKCGAVVDLIFPPIVTFWFGVFPHQAGSEARVSFVHDLTAQFGVGAKAIHGPTRARIGLVGSEVRVAYRMMVARQSELLTRLCALEFGRYEEEKTG